MRRSRPDLGCCAKKNNYDNDFKIYTAKLALRQRKLQVNKVNGINNSSKIISWIKLRKSH